MIVVVVKSWPRDTANLWRLCRPMLVHPLASGRIKAASAVVIARDTVANHSFKRCMVPVIESRIAVLRVMLCFGFRDSV
jgi:hypothetical protein